MHELSLVQSVVEICEQNAAGRRITSVTMEIGDLSSVVPEAVEFCFEACSKGTLLEGARLVIECIPAAGACSDCGGKFPLKAYYDPCPECGSHAITVTAGEELRVKELEVV